MNKMLKLISVVLIIFMLVFSCTPFAAAAQTPSSIIGEISPNMGSTDVTSDLTSIAGKILGFIQLASAIAAVILIAVFGFKFILGSAQEKSDYQKSFIPLIVGVVVVFSASAIGKMIFGLIS